jgi:hypothetical protein
VLDFTDCQKFHQFSKTRLFSKTAKHQENEKVPFNGQKWEEKIHLLGIFLLLTGSKNTKVYIYKVASIVAVRQAICEI